MPPCETAAAFVVITLQMSVSIDADRARVWRALTDPSEVLGWDPRILETIGSPAAYPEEGTPVRWRYRLGSVPVVLHDRPTDVAPPERLASTMTVGSLRIEQTYTLQEEPGDEPRTRLGMKLVTNSSVPVIGEVVNRFDIRRLAAERIDETLRCVQEWCQAHP